MGSFNPPLGLTSAIALAGAAQLASGAVARRRQTPRIRLIIGRRGVFIRGQLQRYAELHLCLGVDDFIDLILSNAEYQHAPVVTQLDFGLCEVHWRTMVLGRIFGDPDDQASAAVERGSATGWKGDALLAFGQGQFAQR